MCAHHLPGFFSRKAAPHSPFDEGGSGAFSILGDTPLVGKAPTIFKGDLNGIAPSWEPTAQRPWSGGRGANGTPLQKQLFLW